jgi:hypothetical protein
VASITLERTASAERAIVRKAWLVGPWFDLLFIANIAWPLLVLLQFSDGFAGRAGLEFWQIYFITTPHRWITMFVVFLDRERFAERRMTFIAIAVVATLLCLVVYTTTGALTCLMAVDYLWNAWHFASQHHGIYRIYGRLSDAPPAASAVVEKWSMRLFLLYVTLRVVSATQSDLTWESYLRIGDWLFLTVPAGLVLRELLQGDRALGGRLTYLVSVMLLYSSLLWAVHERRLGLVFALATASALFHAMEYLALVSWSLRERHSAKGEAMGIMSHLVPRWGIALAVFVVVLGAGAWFMNTRFIEVWLFINVIVAFLHYAYDGLIWRRRRTA